MTATNHALTGAAIGLISGNPAVAIPLALLSHFICDAIPHFGSRDANKTIRSNIFKNWLYLEATMCFAIVATLSVTHPANWQLAVVCAFLAASPDFLWIIRFRVVRAGKKWRPNWFSRFAQDIQWFQRPIGALVEVAWFAGAILMLAQFIH